MKKQLFTLALLTLGYVASSHSMGVLVIAQLTKIKETMAVGTTQEVNAVAAYIVSEKPAHGFHGPVLRLEETKPGKWMITTENPGVASIVLEKKKSGYTKKFHAAEHDITVTGTEIGSGVTDTDGLVVESIESVVDADDECIMVDEIEMDSVKKHAAMEMNSEVGNDLYNPSNNKF